jgi:hypothetical protein
VCAQKIIANGVIALLQWVGSCVQLIHGSQAAKDKSCQNEGGHVHEWSLQGMRAIGLYPVYLGYAIHVEMRGWGR